MDVKSEQAGMAGREPFVMGLQANPVQSQPPLIPNMRLAFTSDGTPIYKPILSGVSPNFPGGEGAVGEGGSVGGGGMSGHGLHMEGQMKKKRGRPRKYGPDGTMALTLTPVSGGGSGQSAGSPLSPLSGSSPGKKARGRPPGSGRKQQMAALGSAGIGFTPHVITVKAGEDVASKIMSFSQHGPRAVCILTANGSISNCTLRQAAMSGGTVTYEGRFEILSLSGSFLLTENGGQRSRTGGMSVSLAGPDGRVLGGGVAGQLTAASPVQVVVGSFIADGGRKEIKPAVLTEGLPAGQSPGTASTPPRGPLGEAGGDATSPPRPSPAVGTNPFNNGGQSAMSTVIWK